MDTILQTPASETKPVQATRTAPPILLATDATSQSEPAMELAGTLASLNGSPVEVITVVDHVPTPWGGVDRQMMVEYERAMEVEIRERTQAQVRRVGNADWPIEVRVGDPATVISDLALECQARLIMVGLGGHGPTARLFGSETALRLMRISRVPVLAVAPHSQTLPRRIVVAMDFSEASIDAARLALEISANNATIILVHVVPWERKDYVPEQWFAAHETKVIAELTRVSRWLDETRRIRIVHRVLYGRVASTLLAFADEMGADMIAAGTHGRGVVGRFVGGQTISRLVRGARCSVLVQPRHVE